MAMKTIDRTRLVKAMKPYQDFLTHRVLLEKGHWTTADLPEGMAKERDHMAVLNGAAALIGKSVTREVTSTKKGVRTYAYTTIDLPTPV